MSDSKPLPPRRQSGPFRLTVPGAAKRTRRRKQTKRTQRHRPATPLTPVEIERLRRRRPLWSEDAARVFVIEGSMRAIEASDTAAFSGTVGWAKTRGRPRKINQATIACEQAALAAAVEADQSLKKRKNALRFVAMRFKDQVQPVPLDGQLLRSIVWPVIGKAIRKSRNLTQPASQPVPHNDGACEHGLGAVAVAAEKTK